LLRRRTTPSLTTATGLAASTAAALCRSRRRWGITDRGRTSMARPAFNSARNRRHAGLAIDGLDHPQHFASDLLVLFIFRGKIVATILLNMAERARDAKLNIERLHLRDNLRACHIFQDLDVNQWLLRALTTASAASATATLRNNVSRDEKHHNCDYKNHACNPMGQLSHRSSFQTDHTNMVG
jgi:hypothetical protein